MTLVNLIRMKLCMNLKLVLLNLSKVADVL